MTTIARFTKNRDIIYDLLKRAKRYHSTCTSTHEFDISNLMEHLDSARESGRQMSLNACLIKAISLVIEKYPYLNHHLFHGLSGKYRAEFQDINCNMVMMRRHNRESITLPVVIRNSNTLSVKEIDEVIHHNLVAPLDELPQIQGIQRLKKLPRIALRWFSYKCRSDYRFYQKYFGTFGFSSAIVEGKAGVIEQRLGTLTHAMANTCLAMLPNAVSEEALVIEGEIEIRKVLSFTLLIDHNLVEAQDVMIAMRYFKRLLSDPGMLGLEDPQDH